MAWPAIIAAGAQIAGSMYGASQADKQAQAARDMQKEALAQFSGMEGYLPTQEQMQLALEQLQQVGELTPEMEQLMQMGPSAMESISLDPQMRAKQMDALNQISQIADTGMSPADMAAMELIKRNVAGENKSRQNAVLQNMQQRGIGGSGNELLARLQATQDSADRESQMALEQAKMQQEARRQALLQQSQMASGLRTQDYGEQSDLARARDVINQFNTANAQNVQQRNVGNRNQAAATNLGVKQEISNQNTAIRNQQQQYNKNLGQSEFDNRMKIAAGKSGQLGGMANSANQQAGQTAGMYAGIGQGVGNMIAGMYGNKKEE